MRVRAFNKHMIEFDLNYMRCTMGESRLSSLAIVPFIKYDMPIDLDEVVNLFEGLHPRMMQLQSLLYETE